jgi:hypothetical protein
VATVWFRSGNSTPDFIKLKLPLVYGQVSNPKPYEVPGEGVVWGTGNEKPTHISVIFSSSYRGDYFEGAPGSELIVNDFMLYYKD